MTSSRIDQALARAQSTSSAPDGSGFVSDGNKEIGLQEAQGLVRVLVQDGYQAAQRAKIAAALQSATPEARALLEPFALAPQDNAAAADTATAGILTEKAVEPIRTAATLATGLAQARAVLASRDASPLAVELAHLSVIRVASSAMILGVPLEKHGMPARELSRLGGESLQAYIALKAGKGLTDDAAANILAFIKRDNFVTPEEHAALGRLLAHRPLVGNSNVWGAVERLARTAGRTNPEEIRALGGATFDVQVAYPLLWAASVGAQITPEEYREGSRNRLGGALAALQPLEGSGSSLELRIAAADLHETALSHIREADPDLVRELGSHIPKGLDAAQLEVLNRLLATAPPSHQGRVGWLFHQLDVFDAKKDEAGAAGVREELERFIERYPSPERYEALIQAWHGKAGAEEAVARLRDRLTASQRETLNDRPRRRLPSQGS